MAPTPSSQEMSLEVDGGYPEPELVSVEKAISGVSIMLELGVRCLGHNILDKVEEVAQAKVGVSLVYPPEEGRVGVDVGRIVSIVKVVSEQLEDDDEVAELDRASALLVTDVVVVVSSHVVLEVVVSVPMSVQVVSVDEGVMVDVAVEVVVISSVQVVLRVTLIEATEIAVPEGLEAVGPTVRVALVNGNGAEALLPESASAELVDAPVPVVNGAAVPVPIVGPLEAVALETGYGGELEMAADLVVPTTEVLVVTVSDVLVLVLIVTLSNVNERTVDEPVPVGPTSEVELDMGNGLELLDNASVKLAFETGRLLDVGIEVTLPTVGPRVTVELATG